MKKLTDEQIMRDFKKSHMISIIIVLLVIVIMIPIILILAKDNPLAMILVLIFFIGIPVFLLILSIKRLNEVVRNGKFVVRDRKVVDVTIERRTDSDGVYDYPMIVFNDGVKLNMPKSVAMGGVLTGMKVREPNEKEKKYIGKEYYIVLLEKNLKEIYLSGNYKLYSKSEFEYVGNNKD